LPRWSTTGALLSERTLSRAAAAATATATATATAVAERHRGSTSGALLPGVLSVSKHPATEEKHVKSDEEIMEARSV